jgi:succinate dehydrogenase / fumarate reductase cytochrome b subunit
MSSAVKPSVRPMSPHLQIYRLPLTAYLSILGQRATGIGLAVGLVLLTWWVTAAAIGEGAYAVVASFIDHWFGRLCLFGFSAAISVHLCNGVRHLFWDAGMGFEIKDTERSNLVVLAVAGLLTAAIWLMAI